MKIIFIALAIIAIGIVLFFAWIYLKVWIRRRINYVFSDLVKEGDLEQAQSCFQRTLEAAPLFLAYNQTLVCAAINLDEVDSAQSVRNLRSFFDKVADFYLKRQPQSHFANIFAAGIKKRSNPQLAKQCIKRAMRRNPSWQLCSIGCMVTRDFDVCSSALMGREALIKMPVIAKYADARVSASISLAKTLEIVGTSRAAALCLHQCAKETKDYDLQRYTEVDLTYGLAYFEQSLGKGVAAAELLAQINEVDIYTPYLVLEASLFYLANHKAIKALQCLSELSKQAEKDLPLWYTDGVKAYISVISYITSLYEQNKLEPDPDILDLHLKNLKDAANAYHNIKYMQILAADACLCANQKRQALLYLERAEKLPWQPIEEIDEISGSEIENDSSQSTLAGLIMSLSILTLSSFATTDRALWQLYMDLDQADDALALAKRTIRQEAYDSALEEAWWHFKAYLASEKLNKHKDAKDYLDQASKYLTEYEQDNHIQGMPTPIDQLFDTLAEPRSFGSVDYHLLKAEMALLQPEKEQESYTLALMAILFIMREHPHHLSVLRFLGELIVKEGPSVSANLVLNNLKECYTTIDDLHLMHRVQELRLLSETQAKPDMSSSTEPNVPTHESPTEQTVD